MSSEFTASETTPLRITTTVADITSGGTRTRDTRSGGGGGGGHNSINNIFISHNNNNNNNNNNRFDPEQSPNSGNIHRINNYNNHQHSNNNRKMETNRQIFQRVIIDFTILLYVGLPILFFFLFGEPFKRGFFCDDESLKHPFHDSTVKSWMLYIIGLVLPIGIIIATEFIHARLRSSNQSYKFLKWDIPIVVVKAYKQIGYFGFGAAVSQLTTDIAKYSIGRLRPHFFDVCQPIFKDKTNCSDVKNLGIYHEEFTCSNPLSTPRMIKEMRLSFPSGHSSFSAYTMIYCAIYLHSRMTWRGSKLLKHFLQFILVMLAWGTALSRVSNYKHHWSDALAGSVIGAICAFIVANYVSDLCKKKFDKTTLPTSSSTALTTRHHELTTTSSQSANGQV